MRFILACVFASATLPVVAQATRPIVVRDIDGTTRSLLAPARGTVDLLFFVNTECPISNRYAPEINRICADYRGRGVNCVMVYPDASLTLAAAKTHRADFAFGPSIPAVIDRTFALASAVDATVTPEATIYTSAGRAYRGRIDNLYADVGQARRAATVHDVRASLDALLAGKPVPAPETEPIGCSIERR
jgi:hypothetical protein